MYRNKRKGTELNGFSSRTLASGTTHQYNYPAGLATSLHDQSLESYPPLAISYPESSQRTLMHHSHVHSSRRLTEVGRESYPPSSFSSQYESLLPHPTQISPFRSPGPTPPSFPDLYSSANQSQLVPMQSGSSFSPHPALNFYHAASSSHSESDDHNHPPYHHHPSNFIPIVNTPEPLTTYPLRSEPTYDAESSSISTGSSPEISPSPSPRIETIPSRNELPEKSRKRIGPPKMHRCEICGKEFPRPSGLQTHMNIHNNLKPFICGFRDCLKTFSVRSNAKRHRLTHTGTASKPPPTPTYRVSSHFIEDLPMPPPPSPGPFSLSQVPFRVRWNAPNAPARNSAHPVQLSGVEPVAGTVLPTNGIHARYDRSSSGAEP